MWADTQGRGALSAVDSHTGVCGGKEEERERRKDGAPLCSLQHGKTPLHLASYHGHHREVELLLAAGANPDLQDKVRTVYELPLPTLSI